MPTLMGCTHSRFDPASRFRFLQYVPFLEAAGWKVSHRPNRPWRHWQSNAAARPLRRLLQCSGGTVRRLSRWVDVREAAHFDVVFVNRDLLGTDLVFERMLVGRNRKVPYLLDDALCSRLMMPLSITYDHRLVDGAAAARFTNEVKGFLAAPGRLLLAP